MCRKTSLKRERGNSSLTLSQSSPIRDSTGACATNGNFIRDFLRHLEIVLVQMDSGRVCVGRDSGGGMPIKPTQKSAASAPPPRRVMRDAILWFPFPSSTAAAAASGYLSIYLSSVFSDIPPRGRYKRGRERRREVSGGVDCYPRSRCGGKEEEEAGRQAHKWPETFFVFSLLSRL